MRAKFLILSIAFAALPMTASAQTLVEPNTLPPNFGEAPAPQVSNPDSPRPPVRPTLVPGPKQNVVKPVPPQSKQVAMTAPAAAPPAAKPAPFVQPAPRPPVSQPYAPRRNSSINPEIEVSERVIYAQEGDMVRMKVIRDFKIDGQIVRSESAEVLGKPSSFIGRSSGRKGKSKASDFAPRSDFDQPQAKESEGPLY